MLAHHRDHPVEPGIDLVTLAATMRVDAPRLRAALDGAPDLVVERGVARDASHLLRASESPEARELLDALTAAPFAPPTPAETGTDPSLVRDAGRARACSPTSTASSSPRARSSAPVTWSSMPCARAAA